MHGQRNIKKHTFFVLPTGFIIQIIRISTTVWQISVEDTKAEQTFALEWVIMF